jgi:hypothetical protein
MNTTFSNVFREQTQGAGTYYGESFAAVVESVQDKQDTAQ